MKYPIAIEWGNDQIAAGIAIPDIPGAWVAGDSLEEAYEGAHEVAHIRLAGLALAGEAIPMPSGVARYRDIPEFAGMSWASTSRLTWARPSRPR